MLAGDEILKGQTQDINSHHLCKMLHEAGVYVKQISVIGDDLELIASEVKLMLLQCFEGLVPNL